MLVSLRLEHSNVMSSPPPFLQHCILVQTAKLQALLSGGAHIQGFLSWLPGTSWTSSLNNERVMYWELNPSSQWLEDPRGTFLTKNIHASWTKVISLNRTLRDKPLSDPFPNPLKLSLMSSSQERMYSVPPMRPPDTAPLLNRSGASPVLLFMCS